MADYKIGIEKIYPGLSEEQLFENTRCILGISMGNPVFWRSSLNEVVEWTNTNFETTYYVIADYLNRYNELFLNKISEKEAISKSILLGDDLENRLKDVLKSVSHSKYEILRWKNLYDNSFYAKEINVFLSLYKENKMFSEAIDKQAAQYISRIRSRNIPITVSEDYAIYCSAQYLVEELAIFSKMMESEKTKVLCYPGAQLPIFIYLVEGKYSNIIPTLENGVYVHLKVTKK